MLALAAIPNMAMADKQPNKELTAQLNKCFQDCRKAGGTVEKQAACYLHNCVPRGAKGK